MMFFSGRHPRRFGVTLKFQKQRMMLKWNFLGEGVQNKKKTLCGGVWI